VLKSYYERLVAFPVDKSARYWLESNPRSGKLAAQATNAIAEAYLAFHAAAKQDAVAQRQANGLPARSRRFAAEACGAEVQGRATPIQKSNLLVGQQHDLSNQQLGAIQRQVGNRRAAANRGGIQGRFIREALARQRD